MSYTQRSPLSPAALMTFDAAIGVAPIWTPSGDRVASAKITTWLNTLREQGIVPAEVLDMHSLQRWSVDNIDAFWAAVWREADILADAEFDSSETSGAPPQPWRAVLSHAQHFGSGLPDRKPEWFTGARINYAENVLRRTDGRDAIIAWNEGGQQRRITFGSLMVLVARTAAALRDAGVGEGDRVAGFLPNIPEAVVAMLAASSIGAIWSSCSPEFGVESVLDRFQQIEPKVLIAADGYIYSGKQIDCISRLREIAAALPTVTAIWVVDNHVSANALEDVITDIVGAEMFTHMLARYSSRTVPHFIRFPFDHPLYILYSSGTTGRPKCIVHGAGGSLLQHWKEHALHTDVSEIDVVFYYTTCGWMMWNWLVSVLATGASIVLYDGAPLPSESDILWRMAAAAKVTVFGTSAKYLATCESLEVTPRLDHDLSSLRTILSTGSPLAAHSYDYVYRDVRDDVALCSISGGTDIVSCFALGDSTGAVYRGELQVRGLGMAVEIFGEGGESVGPGVAGELVCTKPFPSMPVAFWNDADGAKYHGAYFSEYPGVWRHGDWAELTEHDGLVIHGRSDSTLNPGGVRIGTAEIYRQVEQVHEVLECVVVEQRLGGDNPGSRVVLFVRLRDGDRLDEALRDTIRKTIRQNASPHHVPGVIAQVSDIPRTISGKISEIAVRNVLHGRDAGNAGALANPDSLELFRNHPSLG